MASSVREEFVPWHVYERDVQRLSDDIDKLVRKIDGLGDGISALARSQHHDEIVRETAVEVDREKRTRRWSIAVAVVSASLSLAGAVAMFFITRGLA